MTSSLKDCKARALKLSPKERAALAEQLITSLDALDNDETECLWLEEADKRYKQYKQQGIPARSAKDVLRDARLAIR